MAAVTEAFGTGRGLGAAWKLVQVALATLILFGSMGGTGTARPSVLVRDADRSQHQLVDWAIGRYEASHLDLPAIEVRFHPNAAACGGNSGFSAGGRIDMCSDSPSIGYLRATLLHEMAHAWLERHATASLRNRFLRLRGLHAWSSPEVPWGLRGAEQAAETLAWGLGDGSVVALVPDDDPEGLTSAFVALTGRQPLNPEAAPTDREEEA